MCQKIERSRIADAKELPTNRIWIERKKNSSYGRMFFDKTQTNLEKKDPKNQKKINFSGDDNFLCKEFCEWQLISGSFPLPVIYIQLTTSGCGG